MQLIKLLIPIKATTILGIFLLTRLSAILRYYKIQVLRKWYSPSVFGT